MSDLKSKLPDLKELASMTSKLYNDIKTSVGQIVQDYKDTRAQSGEENSSEAGKSETPAANDAKPEDTKK